MRTLTFFYRWPGLIEAVASKSDDAREEIDSEGYRDSGIYDLMIDIDLLPDSNKIIPVLLTAS